MENLPQKEEWDEELLVEQMLPQRGNRSVEKELDLIERKIPLPDYFLLLALYHWKAKLVFFAVKPVTVDPKLAKNELLLQDIGMFPLSSDSGTRAARGLILGEDLQGVRSCQ